ncbi:hypothetical protein FG93_04194 [Bosea sp. LC85]|nr:hypothetical protein FG93_04194 [Bosea sp. LC85]
MRQAVNLSDGATWRADRSRHGGRVLLAGALMLVIGLIHSVLGEMLIFRHMRRGSLVPTMGQPLLRERHVRILWASWHLPSILGWGHSAFC